VLTIDDFRLRLDNHAHQEIPDFEGMTRAAVAAILRAAGAGPELLFIHRAEDPRDPWSGHMAFPGGKVDAVDADPLAAALRETREEVGLDLAAEAQPVGRLSDVRAVGRGRPLSMVISPFVFELQTTPELTTNYEVAAVVWVPVAFLADHGNRETMLYKRYGMSLELPCYRFRGHLIWGLTLGMVDDLLRLVTVSSEVKGRE
jgi:8-oxo-dGTP pyrophosphatase MutT (NUDIX family)